MADIPAYCPHCGNIFRSAIQISPKRLKISGHPTETCPRCHGEARTIEGVFDASGDILRMLSGPDITPAILKRFASMLRKAQEEEITEQELITQAEEIKPGLGKAIKNVAAKGGLMIVLWIIFTALQNCQFSLDAKVDVNRLVDQAVEILEDEEQPMLPGSAPIPTPRVEPASKEPASRQVRRQMERRDAKSKRRRR
ncbi:MAG: hypothetical protein EOS51_18165 [Mesorhizobium sp.]|uniref:hypothetical protein n=1 Tax=unclassified Mesorhizobium TaxID=325217 RepID=UPI000FE4926F|nr:MULTISPECIES: hypothetical protein [unclassified Mesorhizobium]RWC17055.1 MAG: hypothetical protein EOS51_18165 [Mesorhizobium sp.]TGU01271.1 hypothetical protein EN807_16455 [Mesorhizobium sp. M5C.F.Ca.ET.164.01.1.1]